jgi:uncharacterized protein (UPF0332 family)
MKLAILLAEDTNNESKLRSSISRAYYSMFHCSKNYMQEVDKRFESVPTDVSVHGFIIDYFNGKKSSKKTDTRRHLARDLNRLRIERNIADYERNAGSLHHLKQKTTEVTTIANRITELLKMRQL